MRAPPPDRGRHEGAAANATTLGRPRAPDFFPRIDAGGLRRQPGSAPVRAGGRKTAHSAQVIASRMPPTR